MMWAGERHYTWQTKLTLLARCRSLLSGFCISASRPGLCQHDRVRENSEGPILTYCSFPFSNAENITLLLIISILDKSTYLRCLNLNNILHFMSGTEHLGIFNASTVWGTRWYIQSKMMELWYLQFSWGQLNSFLVQIDSRCFTETQDLTPKSNCGKEKFPLIRKDPWAGPSFWFLRILLFLEVIISLLRSPFGWLTHCVYIIFFLVCFTALSIKPKQSLWCYRKWSNLIFGVWSSAGDGTVRM